MDFTQVYNRTSWLNFLEDSFLPDDFRITDETVQYQKDFTKEVTKLGECPSLQLTVFEINHTSVNDARVGLSKEAFTLVRDYTKYNRALALFVPQSSNEKYRFSYIEFTPEFDEAGKIQRKISNPRRYSYLLGNDCKKHTPTKYLIEEGEIKAQIRNTKHFTANEDLIYRFSVEVLTKEFYDRLYNWYEWALDVVRFPEGSGRSVKLTDKDNEMHLIRLITRLIFVWFIKQKKLVPEWIFDKTELNKTLKNFKPDSLDSGDYYNGILQNLFFATLNNEIKERAFTKDTKKYGNEQFGVKFFYRDRNDDTYFIKTTNEIQKMFSSIPFLNGGLFECLDKNRENPKKPGHDLQEYHDGFSREKKCCAFVPDILFFNDIEKGKQAGLISLFNLFNFTVEENTPVDVDVALDPELLGKVFENLLGYYNEETRTTARKESGSFYTPREIVDYMVSESLKSYLNEKISVNEKKSEMINNIFSYSEDIPDISLTDRKSLIKLIDECIIIDPACGSGAFPMGVLNKLSLALFKLDKNGKLWKERQEERAQEEAKNAITIDNQNDREIKLKEISETFELNKTEYGHKLYLIENCLFGVDIKPIAIQITKLRFFISLIVEQEKDELKTNFGIRPLPNLETKFVCANSLISLSAQNKDLLDLEDDKIQTMKKKLWNIREKHFYTQKLTNKKKLRNDDKKQRNEIKEYLLCIALKPNKELIANNISQITDLEVQRDTVKDEKFVDISKDNTHLFDNLNDGLPQYIDINLEKRNKIDAELKHLREEIEKEKSKSDNKTIHVDIDRIADWDPYDQNAEAAQFFDPYWMFNVKEGFDIVIGNPPYVEHKKLKNTIALIKDSYDVYSGTADLSVYFIEKGLKLCKAHGFMSYITTNKFFNTIYGKPVREYLLKYQIKYLLDFEQVAVFENTLVSTTIIGIVKRPHSKDVFIFRKYYKMKHTEFISRFQTDIYLGFDSYNQSYLGSTEWSFANNDERIINEKIRLQGKLIKNIYGVKIFRGVTTGYNPAFLIDKINAKQLIKADNKNKHIIKSILQGRNIKKWVYKESHDYFLLTNYDTDIQKEYPFIYNHLEKYIKELKTRTDQGKKWWNLRSCSYYKEFEKEKIIWGLTADKWAFAYDNNKHYLPSNGYILTSSEIPIKYILAILNSSLMKYYFGFIGVMTAGGAYTLKHGTIRELPIKISTNMKIFIDLVDKILNIKTEKSKEDISVFERQIDNLVYRLYNLTYNEVKLIEPDFPLSKKEYEGIENG
jgi:hypothetical protein